MMDYWYALTVDGQRAGPFDTPQLIAALRAGQLDPRTKLNKAGSNDWLPVAAWPELRVVAVQATTLQQGASHYVLSAKSNGDLPRSWPLAAGLFVAPCLLLVLQLVAFDGFGATPLWLLLLACCAISAAILLRPAWKEQPPLELLRRAWSKRAFRNIGLGVVALAEVVALIGGAVGLVQASQERDAERMQAQQQASAEREREEEKAGAALHDAIAKLSRDGPNASGADLMSLVAVTCKALATAKQAGALSLQRVARGVEFCTDAKSIAKPLLNTAPSRPPEPGKPELKLPEYEGVVRIKGKIRGPYKGGGVVLDDNGELMLLEDGAMPRSPFVVFLRGYADDTGRTVVLDIGRTGRLAKVYRVQDEETFDDDRESHKNLVAAARLRHRNAMTAYKKEKHDYPGKLKEYETAAAKHKVDVEKAQNDLRKHAADYASSQK